MGVARQAPRSRGTRARIMADRSRDDVGPRDTNKAAVRVLTAPTEPSERTGIKKDPAWKPGVHALTDHPATDRPASTE